MFELTQDILNMAGLPAYEVSNHAMSPEHQSVHNMIYWQGGDWIRTSEHRSMYSYVRLSIDRCTATYV